jgi:molybdopterin molybdotransferase
MSHPLLSPQSALDTILADTRLLGAHTVDILDAPGRVLAEDIQAHAPLPPWDNSAMDGYAVRTAEVTPQSPMTIGLTVPAGAGLSALPAGQAARIMTGAPVPTGADGVLMREDADESQPGLVRLSRAPQPGEHIRRRGEDVPEGSTVLTRGTLLRPSDVGLLAGVGRARISVVRAPVVAILATGDELLEVGSPPQPARIINSNAWMLAAQVREAGGIPRLLGIARDTRESLVTHLRQVDGADVLLTSGGVSVGDFDFVLEALSDVGARLAFWKVAIKPGKPLAVGTLGSTRVFGLPGNPVSSFVTFELFVRPALRALQGLSTPGRHTVVARAVGTYQKKPGLTHYVRVRLEAGPDGVRAHVLAQQGSGALTSLRGCDGLMVLAQDRGPLQAGEEAPVLVLHDGWLRAAPGQASP